MVHNILTFSYHPLSRVLAKFPLPKADTIRSSEPRNATSHHPKKAKNTGPNPVSSRDTSRPAASPPP
ncbi:hypothetical protein N658DRAFT_224997 [Parathielavia hyrcaniae]|uniref:Uncharacterized protein n=1 Tax=Parathielavia hyrcaniae TaxID=113614 RepID=A0AAN6PWF5_9PEZI|nr:hypothetical protein N658DRAFT_224997 [Parathielavia hyrcaniae]